MHIKNFIFGFGVALAMTVGGTFAASANGGAEPFMATGGATSAPVGHVEFCKRWRGECGATGRSGQLMPLTRERWDELLAVNAEVNRAIRPVTDEILYRTAEVWTYPTTAGDCEDFALLKRKVLIERGWSPTALLITVVRDTNGGGHAVLTVRTDRGDLVLDNQIEAVLPWYRTPYRYIKRQSVTNAGRWISISDERVSAVASLGR